MKLWNFIKVYQKLKTCHTPNLCCSTTCLTSAFLLHSKTTPPHPKSPAGGLAWSQHATTYRHNAEHLQNKKCVCVPVCGCVRVGVCVYASEPISNEAFTGSSTSGHSSTQVKTCFPCIFVCLCEPSKATEMVKKNLTLISSGC